jgi:aldehyde:ferredoxin oxidoreductase
MLSAHLSFTQAERLLSELTGVALSARQIETVAESIGAEAEQLNKQDEKHAASQDLPRRQRPHQPEMKTYIAEMDGVQVGLEDRS